MFAAFTTAIAAMHNGTGKAYFSAQVIPPECIGCLTLGTVWNGRNAQGIILAQHGGYLQGEEVNISTTTLQVTLELKKHPHSFDGVERL
jgi:hypothetical protein